MTYTVVVFSVLFQGTTFRHLVRAIISSGKPGHEKKAQPGDKIVMAGAFRRARASFLLKVFRDVLSFLLMMGGTHMFASLRAVWTIIKDSIVRLTGRKIFAGWTGSSQHA